MGLQLLEIMMRDAIEEGLGFFRADTRTIDVMLEDLTTDERDMFRSALALRAVKVRYGWPGEPPEDVTIAIMLESTQGRQTLGQVTSSLEEGSGPTATLAAACTAEPLVALTLTGPAPVVPARGVLRIGQEYATYSVALGVVTLVARGIKGTPALPHDSGLTVLFPEFLQGTGYPETSMLRVDVLGLDPDFIIVLARMLKAYLTARGDLFDARGITLQHISETDLAPRPAGLIGFFIRTLHAQVFATMSVTELVPVVGGTEVTLDVTTEVYHGQQPELVVGE